MCVCVCVRERERERERERAHELEGLSAGTVISGNHVSSEALARRATRKLVREREKRERERARERERDGEVGREGERPWLVGPDAGSSGLVYTKPSLHAGPAVSLTWADTGACVRVCV